MPNDSLATIDFQFEDDVSSRGKPVKYVVFADGYRNFTQEEKAILKQICDGYFFYSPTRKKWGFPAKNKNHEVYVYNYLKYGILPDGFSLPNQDRDFTIPRQAIPFNVEDFVFTYVELKGRPLFYFEHVRGKIEISINLKHWFFTTGDEIEKEIVRKFALTLVGTAHQFTSTMIESFFVKLACIQENLKYSYDRDK